MLQLLLPSPPPLLQLLLPLRAAAINQKSCSFP
jgi:hypothetical protein